MAAPHWTSHYTDEGPSFLPEDGRTLMVSVVLDAGAERDYEGIRVIIVHREDAGADMFINERMDLFRPSHAIGSNYRKSLTSLRSLEKPKNRGTHLARTEKLCTIIFELASLQTYWGQFASLSPMGYSTQVPIQPPARVVLDHIEHTVSSTLFYLYCSHSTQPNFSPGGTIRKPTRHRAHFIRVIPVAKSRPPWSTWSLPQTLLSHIITIAFSEKPKGWRRGLLACSLVCKSWAYLVELFFDDFHGTPASCMDHDPPDISSVAHSLERNFSRGVLIKNYSPSQYLRRARLTNVAFMAFCEAQNTILRHATAVKHVSLELTHIFLFRDLIDILCGLRHVQSLRVTRLQRFAPLGAGDVRHLTFEEILKIIPFWPRLKKLTIANWRESSESDFPFHVVSQPVQISCPIEDIDLSVGILNLPNLLYLTGPLSAPPTLRIAHFEGIMGLTNLDFITFLQRVAPTLVDLSITACPLPRHSNDEEYALDAAMPFLTSLEVLTLDGELSTAKALSRKAPRLRPPGDNGVRAQRHRISLSHSPKTGLEGVLDAMSVTGWDSICVHLDSSNEYSPQLSVMVAEAAKARGIDFRISIAARGLGSDSYCGGGG